MNLSPGKSANWLSWCGLWLVLSLLADCTTITAQTNTNSTASGSTDILRPGDKITVTLSDIPMGPIHQELTISDEGKITLHLNQTFSAAGKTRAVLQEEIHERYYPSLYKQLTVTIKPEERFFYVEGQVKAPNRYLYSGELSVLKAITAAGGFTDFANRKKVQVTRGSKKTETINCEKAKEDPKLDLPIYPGDIISVPKRWW